MNHDIRTLDLNLLKALDALIDEGSVTRAAQRLSLTQPAVSGMLTRLRDYFDDPLFVRAQRGMVPTARAIELAAPVKQILTDISVLLKPAAFEPMNAEMTCAIMATDYALQAVIVPLMSELKKRAPGIRIAVLPVDNERLFSLLERGQVDLALVTPTTTPGDLHGRALYNEEYVCMLRADHPLTRSATLSLDSFCEQEHILVSSEGGFWGATDEALAKMGRTRRVGMSVNSFLVLPEILRRTDMIAVVPRRLTARQEGLALMAPPLDVPGFTKSMAWHERNHRDPAHQWIRALCIEVSQAHKS